MNYRPVPNPAAPTSWPGHIDGWLQSGLSQRRYCEEYGLALSTFQWWRRRLRSEPVVPADCVDLVPVPRQSMAAVRASRGVTIVVGDGRYRIELVESCVVPEDLHAVLDVLEARR